ncbi:hypothetical protein IFM89_030747 [Coptis chinensis]|uniref:NuBaID C-terminal domain-containing protein n=1 Tax=Coptis chinensis TaxID=261450 RepID=A0A835MGA9_9MAGN|nr:hypothetical protein IFM89_030747 [Coptis chinensis]
MLLTARTVPRPLEWFRIVESLEINGQAESTNSGANVANRIAGTPVTIDCREENCVGHNSGTMGTATSTKERSLTLNSIAGGPSPAKQNYKATVSLPILSRHLRADLSSRFDDRCNVMPNVSSLDHETAECNLASHNSLHRENDQLCNIIVQPEDVVITPEKDDERLGMSKGNSHSCLEEGDHVRNVNDCTYSEKDGGTAPDANGMVKNQMHSSNNSFRMSTDDISTHQVDESASQAGRESVSVSSSPEMNLTLNMACRTNLEKDNKGSDHQRSLNLEGTDEEVEGLKDTVHSSVNNELVAVNDLKLAQSDQGMEFDPIRQHRHFCPWIMSTAKTGPGWKLTLSALDREMTSSRPSLPDSPSSSMLECVLRFQVSTTAANVLETEISCECYNLIGISQKQLKLVRMLENYTSDIQNQHICFVKGAGSIVSQ